MLPPTEEMELHRLLSAIDHAPPAVSAADIMSLARRRLRVRRTVRRLAIGAALAASALAAAPSSPLRRMVSRAVAGSSTTVERRAQPAVTPAAERQSARGIAFVPGPAVEIVFRNAQPTGSFRVRIDTTAMVRVTHASGASRFDVNARGVSIDNDTADRGFDISVPRGVARALVRVGSRVVFMKQHSRISAAVERDRSGSYLIPFASSTSVRKP